MAGSSGRFVFNPRVYDELASTSFVHGLLSDAAEDGSLAANELAPHYAGPTFEPGVSRDYEYSDSIYWTTTMTPRGWRAEFGADAPWALQVEYGSGGNGRRRHNTRPQGGWNKKTRTLWRALNAIRSR